MIDLLCGISLIGLLSSGSLYVVLNRLDPEGDSQNENRTMCRSAVMPRDTTHTIEK